MKYILLFLSCIFSNALFAQKSDSTQTEVQYSADIIFNNNGISRIPSLSLMKPAAQFNLFYIHNRWIIDPQFFFSAELKPWISNYWVHYKMIDKPNWNLVGGGSLMVTYKTVSANINNVVQDRLVGNRYLDFDLLFTKKLNSKLSFSVYYMVAKGIEETSFNNLNFFALSLPFSNISLGPKLKLKSSPQIYYLQQGEMKGYYFSDTFGIRTPGRALGLFGMFTFPFETNFVPNNGFIWSLGLNCVVGGKYLKKKAI